MWRSLARRRAGWWLLLPFVVACQGDERQTALESERPQVVERLAIELERGYVFAEMGASMARAVRERLASGAYRELSEAEFANALMNDARALSHDMHLRVRRRMVPGTGMADGPPSPGPAVARVEVLPENVGYLELRAFPPAERLAGPLNEAMSTLANTDALILDVRDNPGGAADGVMYLAGFFFEQRTLMASIYSRTDDKTSEMYTLDVNGPRYRDKPLFILTSRKTHSAGEAAAYHLKYVAGAKIVGETTGGRAHRVRSVDIGHGYVLDLPFTRPINVVTKADWEGTGVAPDIAVPAVDALDAARLAAIAVLPKTPEREALRQTLKQPVVGTLPAQ